MDASSGTQPTFVGLGIPEQNTAHKTTASLTPAESNPVARCLLHLSPPHLDREFDYLVSQKLDAQAVPGARLKVPFGAQQVDAYLVERIPATEHTGSLKFVSKVVSPEPVANAEIIELARRVAARYCGSVNEVLRFAIPPRHATTEKLPYRASEQQPPHEPADPEQLHRAAQAWQGYPAGEQILTLLSNRGEPKHVVWSALPHWVADESGSGSSSMVVAASGAQNIPHWAQALSYIAHHAAIEQVGLLIVVPELEDLDVLTQALQQLGLTVWDGHGGHFARIHQAEGPAKRYQQYLAASRDQVRIVIGTRSAAYSPLHRSRLLVCWDDSHSAHREQQAPYPHTREVLIQRAAQSQANLLIAGFTRSIEAQALLSTGWAQPLTANRQQIRQYAPLVHALHSGELAATGELAQARLPERVWREIKQASAHGPVLIQVPRGGYLPVISCQQCRELARCRHCQGPIALTERGELVECTWCGKPDAAWRCPHCKGTQIRAVRIGSQRTAEELGRAFPGVPIINSAAKAQNGVLRSVVNKPSIVVATPGAEPAVPGGYGLVVILDAAVATAGAELNAPLQALHQWTRAAVRAKPRVQGGTVLLVGDGEVRASDALVRWDSPGFVEREYQERLDLQLPPTVRTISITGESSTAALFLANLDLPAQAAILGPVQLGGKPGALSSAQLGGDVRYILRSPLSQAIALTASVRARMRTMSAQHGMSQLRVQVDPRELL